MAKGTTRSEVLEAEYVAGVSLLIPAALVFLLALLSFWGLKVMNGGNYPASSVQILYLKPLFLLLGITGVIGAIGLAAKSSSRMYAAKSRPVVTVNCPYCKFPMKFVTSPTEDYDCEGCHRRVLYSDGKPIPTKEVICNFCQAEHKVAITAKTLICDQCNRPIRLIDPKNTEEVVSEQSDMLQNYDVKLTDIGRNKNEVAMALQSILICNLPEARRQMENLPLTIARNIPERKADSFKRKLRELGATAVVVMSETSEQGRTN
ncbi:MAG: ribosomal protein L7/L12 [Chthonomonadales bacterium]